MFDSVQIRHARQQAHSVEQEKMAAAHLKAKLALEKAHARHAVEELIAVRNQQEITNLIQDQEMQVNFVFRLQLECVLYKFLMTLLFIASFPLISIYFIYFILLFFSFFIHLIYLIYFIYFIYLWAAKFMSCLLYFLFCVMYDISLLCAHAPCNH